MHSRAIKIYKLVFKKIQSQKNQSPSVKIMHSCNWHQLFWNMFFFKKKVQNKLFTKNSKICKIERQVRNRPIWVQQTFEGFPDFWAKTFLSWRSLTLEMPLEIWWQMMKKKQLKRKVSLFFHELGNTSCYTFSFPSIIYGNENYSKATAVFLFLFFQTHFANLKFVQFVQFYGNLWLALVVSQIWSVISPSVLVAAFYFLQKVRATKVPMYHVPNFCQSNPFVSH